MDSFRYGATITLRAEFYDPDTRQLESPASTPVVTATAPTGATSLPPVTEAAEGVFVAQVTPAESEQGVWTYAWEDPSGPGPDPASAESSYFLVRD